MRNIDDRAQCNTNEAIPPAENRIIGKPKDLAIRHIRPDELTDIEGNPPQCLQLHDIRIQLVCFVCTSLPLSVKKYILV